MAKVTAMQAGKAASKAAPQVPPAAQQAAQKYEPWIPIRAAQQDAKPAWIEAVNGSTVYTLAVDAIACATCIAGTWRVWLRGNDQQFFDLLPGEWERIHESE